MKSATESFLVGPSHYEKKFKRTAGVLISFVVTTPTEQEAKFEKCTHSYLLAAKQELFKIYSTILHEKKCPTLNVCCMVQSIESPKTF